jgi:hypothetical protein
MRVINNRANRNFSFWFDRNMAVRFRLRNCITNRAALRMNAAVSGSYFNFVCEILV